MGELVGLVGFSFVGAVTPGPNNVLLWASGIEFGFRRTVRHIFGSSIGIGAMALAVAAGVGVLVTAVPELAFGMRLIGSLYLLHLAYRIAGARALERGHAARPMGVAEAAAFQLINPKAWVVVLGAMSTFRPADMPLLAGSILAAGTMSVVVVPAFALWAGGGDVLGRLIVAERARRSVSFVLAALVIATVVYVWV